MKKRTKKEFPLINKAPSKPLISKKQRSHFFHHYHFSIIPDKILLDKNLNAMDLRILILILKFGYQGLQFYMSDNKIANIFDSSRRTVIRSINRLQDKGYIKCLYLELDKGDIKRYIILDLKKCWGKPDKDKGHSLNKSAASSSYKLNKADEKPLSANQKQQINKAIHIIGRNVTSYNPKYLKKRFISEYQHGKLSFSNFNNALINYQYDKMNHKNIRSSVGYICLLTKDKFNKNEINKMMRKNRTYQNNQKNNEYLINGKPFIKVKRNIFKKDVEHKLATNQITKNQYDYYWKEFDKYGDRYGDDF